MTIHVDWGRNPSWSNNPWSASTVDEKHIETELEDSKFDHIIKKRLAQGRDFQALITSKNGNRGLGKTTLAIALARKYDLNGWGAHKGFMGIWDFLRYYLKDSTEGDVLIQDETELQADSRRWNSGKNVHLSHVIAAARFKEVPTIYTLPNLEMLDDRIVGLCTFWIHVGRRGRARVFVLMQNDFTGDVLRLPLKGYNGHQIQLYWDDMTGEEDYEVLSEKKEKYMRDYIQRDVLGNETDEEGVPNNMKKEYEKTIRDNIIVSIRKNNPDMTQRNIAEKTKEITEEAFEFKISCSQSKVWNVLDERGLTG